MTTELEELRDAHAYAFSGAQDAPETHEWLGMSLHDYDAWLDHGTRPASWTPSPEVSGAVLINRAWTKWGFCACGDHLAVWSGIREVLEHDSLEDREPLEGRLAVYALLCDVAEFTEHGGSVYGAWLTDAGRLVLDELRGWK